MAIDHWKQRAGQLKRETYALYLAARDPRVPWYTKALAICVVGYALSPLDLIPDFIPIVGYLDDLILVPLGIVLVLRLIPPEALADCRERAQVTMDRGIAAHSLSERIATIAIVFVWLLVLALVVMLALRAIVL
ncbi:MAG TPA: YkvA family protein [Ktedonobacterales bacterium]|nr:YkvA family protein [Ktedonobacterales bacterium]